MHPLTRKLAAAPEEWLWMHTQSRTSCPARCYEGKVYYQTERSSWEYPGAWEGRPCERCGGRGYLTRVWRWEVRHDRTYRQRGDKQNKKIKMNEGGEMTQAVGSGLSDRLDD